MLSLSSLSIGVQDFIVLPKPPRRVLNLLHSPPPKVCSEGLMSPLEFEPVTCQCNRMLPTWPQIKTPHTCTISIFGARVCASPGVSVVFVFAPTAVK